MKKYLFVRKWSNSIIWRGLLLSCLPKTGFTPLLRSKVTVHLCIWRVTCKDGKNVGFLSFWALSCLQSCVIVFMISIYIYSSPDCLSKDDIMINWIGNNKKVLCLDVFRNMHQLYLIVWQFVYLLNNKDAVQIFVGRIFCWSKDHKKHFMSRYKGSNNKLYVAMWSVRFLWKLGQMTRPMSARSYC